MHPVSKGRGQQLEPLQLVFPQAGGKSAEIFLVWEFHGKLPQTSWEELVRRARAPCCNLGFPKHKALVLQSIYKRQEQSHTLC